MTRLHSRWSVVVAVAVLFGAVAGVSALRAEGEDGQAILEAQKCDLCHAVSTVGIEAKTKSEAMKGPDLVDIEREPAWLVQYLKKETELDGQAHKKEYKGTDEDLNALIDWMLDQKSE